jgi:hypothetical protein
LSTDSFRSHTFCVIYISQRNSVATAQRKPACRQKTALYLVETGMIDQQWAREFALDWIASWNAHDMERILSHYTDDFEMSSPLIVERLGRPEGRLKGKEAIRDYWQAGLSMLPALRFELLDVFVGVDAVTIYYNNVGRRLVCETLFFNASGKAIRGMALWSVAET